MSAVSNVLARCAVVSLVSASILAWGCSSSGQVPVYPVKGQLLTADGKPASGAAIAFYPTDGGSTYPFVPHARVDSDGSFALTSYRAGDGAPAGEYTVTVIWRTENPEGDPIGPDRLRGRYSDPKKTPLRAAVAARENVLEPFHLK